MLIVTNFERFPAAWTTSAGVSGRSEFAQDAAGFLRFRRERDAVYLINCDPRLVLELARRRLLPLGDRPPIVGVDLVLREPRSAAARLAALGKRLLFGRAAYFIHYFKDTAALDAIYGIGGRRGGFVDFKANIWHLRADGPRPDGDYAICFGRSLRDFDSFFTAMERAGVPGAITDPRGGAVWAHGSRFTRPLDRLPANVRILPDDLTNESQAAILAKARLVVVPLIRGSLVASGISTILNAMALGKCVIASEGPGVTDLFDREVISVPLEDAEALASAIARAWTDDALRRDTARAGWTYAQHCGSEQDMFTRIIEDVVRRRAAEGW